MQQDTTKPGVEASLLPKAAPSFFGRLLATVKFEKSKTQLKKVLTLFHLIFLGVACCIGCGAYSVIGFAAQHAGPGITYSFVFTGIVCFFTCFPYAEFAAKIQSAGFAYAYVYSTCGEFAAYLAGHALHLLLIASASIAARCWAFYLASFFEMFGIIIPKWLYDAEVLDTKICILGAVAVAAFVMFMLRGMKESTTINNTVSIINVLTLTFAIIAGLTYIEPEKYFQDYTPYGYKGVFAGMGLAFFSYLGFEGLGCFTEEAINPARDLPLSLTIVLIIAIIANGGVAFVMTGMAPLSVMNTNESLAAVFKSKCPSWMVFVIVLGSLAGLLGSVSANLMSQPRIFYSMAQDGLLPKAFKHINPKTGVMDNAVIATGVVSVLIVLLFDVELVGNAVSLAGLLISATVDIAVVASRYKSESSTSTKINIMCVIFYICAFLGPYGMYYEYPIIYSFICFVIMGLVFLYVQFQEQTNMPVDFTCPLVPFIPMMGSFSLLTIAATVDPRAWKMFLIYLVIGVVTYFLFGYHNSNLANPEAAKNEPQEKEMLPQTSINEAEDIVKSS